MEKRNDSALFFTCSLIEQLGKWFIKIHGTNIIQKFGIKS